MNGITLVLPVITLGNNNATQWQLLDKNLQRRRFRINYLKLELSLFMISSSLCPPPLHFISSSGPPATSSKGEETTRPDSLQKVLNRKIYIVAEVGRLLGQQQVAGRSGD